MVKAKYSAMQEKLDNLAEKHELVYIWDTASPHITLTVKPKALETEQTSFIADDEDDKSSSDAAIRLNDAPFLAGHSTTIFSTKFY